MTGIFNIKLVSTGHAISNDLFTKLERLLNEVQTSSIRLERREEGAEKELDGVRILQMQEGCIMLTCSSTIQAYFTLCQVRAQWHVARRPPPADRWADYASAGAGP